MKLTELAAKLEGTCMRPYCNVPCGEASVLCPRHQAANASAVARHVRVTRPARRARQCCADCGRPSSTYRCKGGCVEAQLPLWEAEIITGVDGAR